MSTIMPPTAASQTGSARAEGMLLPAVSSLGEYRRVYRDEHAWLPAMRAVCAQQGLDPAELAFAPPGTHVVFRAGEELYIKLFAPLWGSDYASERAVLAALTNAPDRSVPRLVAEGEIEGWPYVVITAVKGAPLREVWHGLGADERLGIAQQCGAFMAWLHTRPVTELEGIAVDWPTFLGKQTEACIERVVEAGLGQGWVTSVRALLERVSTTREAGFRSVLLSADVTDEHVMVDRRDGKWCFAGYIDFGDAMLGHPLYEFAAPGCTITRGVPALTRALLLGYGYSEPELVSDLAERLTAYTLLHRFVTVSDLLALFGHDRPATLKELQRRLWPLGEQAD